MRELTPPSVMLINEPLALLMPDVPGVDGWGVHGSCDCQGATVVTLWAPRNEAYAHRRRLAEALLASMPGAS